MEPADRLGRRGQRVVRVLDDLVGRQPARRTAEVHRAPAGMKPQPDRRGAGDLRLERIPAAVPGRGRRPGSPARREDVVVIGAGAAPGQGQPAQSGRGRRADVRGLDPGPDRIQLGEPVEQDGLLCAALGEPLVQVVVGIDQARGGQAAGAVDPARPGPRGRRSRARPDRGDPPAAHHDVAAGVLGAAVVVPGAVHGRDRAVLDHDRPGPAVPGRRRGAHAASRPSGRRPAARRPGSSRTPCTGTGCRPAPRGCPGRPARRRCAGAGRGPPRSAPACRSRTAPRRRR